MASETTRLRAKLSMMDASLDELEAQLDPLISKSLPETLVGLETIQQAKLQVALPYLVYDLVFIYLKARGIDPKTHPVVTELDRVRQYFEKIKNAEESEEKKRAGIDKAAAGRFIKHAIAQVKYTTPTSGPSDATSTASTSNVRVPIKVTSKMVERAEYEKNLQDVGSEEEEDLEVFDAASEEDAGEDEAEEAQAKPTKGKQRAVDVDEANKASNPVGSKRKRPRIDPFAGYGDDDSTPSIKSSKKKSKTSASASPAVDDSLVVEAASTNQSGRSTPLSGSDAKKQAKAAKKAKRKAKKSSG
ncbi:hypothetical protein BV22DRAFT_1037119 [Leucogyrophana mollusca]|uniref:Uncharacterized protein n=1 Tax=Leucogyrophana mollusca TaxID=85980 RepID=A0ACB8BB14_9AGAM|nr:hypothetical protein BV22DRAFT_1037119 [Leucogyrophana mollusca]